jgi:hypothetical protein
MRWCLAHAEDVLPRFIDILRRHSAGKGCSDEEEGSIFFVVHLLGEMAAPEAFPHVMDFVTGDPAVVHAVLGEAVTEYLNGILISTYDGDEARLRGCIEDPEVDEYVRSAALDAWAYLVASGKVDRAEASGFLDALVDRGAPQEPHLIWVTYAKVVALLGFDHLKDRVKALFERGLIESREMRYDEFLSDLGAGMAHSDGVVPFHDVWIRPFTDAVGTLSGWHTFTPEGIRERLGEPPLANQGTTERNPLRHVGRNDPCPCGSGKKFKKCCLH